VKVLYKSLVEPDAKADAQASHFLDLLLKGILVTSTLEARAFQCIYGT